MNNPTPPAQLALPGVPDTVDTAKVIDEMVRRAASMGYESWWRRAESVGFCAHPIQLTGSDDYGRARVVWTRCNNRRAYICPSCSDLYARDTWQLVHAGAAGGHHDMPTTVADRPQVFLTLTAPSFGPVHTTTKSRDTNQQVCRDQRRTGGYQRCPHGTPLWCSITHSHDDDHVGQPLCAECYDYVGHVLFTWHLPELWRRFTITLRRALRKELKAAGVDADGVRVSFLKVVELQARAIPHIHALIRLDPHDDPHQTDWESPLGATKLAAIIQHTARTVSLTVNDPCADDDVRMIAFGPQIDTQPVTAPTDPVDTPSAEHNSATRPTLSGRRVARYLAKYVTKSLADLGISARRLSAEAIPDLDVSEHVRAILTTISDLADKGLSGIRRWLHTLGFRGHITSKSRRYSTTMTALRRHRATWTREQGAKNATHEHNPVHQDEDDDGLVVWEFDRAGHTSLGERTLSVAAAWRRIQQRRTAREALQHQHRDLPIEVPDG
ncbi:replication initiator [Mycobacteroides abscessus]|uniref:Replication initiation protein n=2 Tax=Mycobacteroides abscessus TaxID=36809 RepID=A0A0U0ZLF0_9MYCO|nr:replication initiator [Mycobacteroides abscessus]EUA70806.1 putative replication initiator protein [Mycobacteroides abscessus subsp. bolletii 1513]AMU64649.1 plasmid replication initiator protein [Mycobacteroides abscessus]ANN99461.1 plasmid replication initiator protein [Mycobacteroides abscessus]ANO13263.1 plasmid replication initiator protein [Mycobacteroides abscessus]ARQ63515.1 plasmid replication initiator protein [Mycobacteroides abscessus subsp. massiliense]